MNRLLARLGSTLLLATMVISQAAMAQAGPLALGGVAVARSGELYKANGRTLYQREADAGDWSVLELPIAKGASLTDISASAVKDGAVYVAGIGVGVLKSSDGGKRWSDVSQGLPGKDVIALTTHSTEADTVYAVVAEKGFFRSQDAGKTWQWMDKGPRAQVSGLVHSNMEGSMQTGWLFVATDSGVYRSMDCFCLFELAGELPGAVADVTFDRQQPARIFAAVGHQVFISEDGGEQWELAGELSAPIAAVDHVDGVLYALQDDGKVLGSADSGKSWN